MHARNTGARRLEIPALDKDIGFDLIKYDWMAPYGEGENADFIFNLQRQYENRRNYEANLKLTFVNRFDGIQSTHENRRYGSEFKLSRSAPSENYLSEMSFKIANKNGNYNPRINRDINYYFRVRSEEENGELQRAMYGKIHGDILFGVIGSKTGYLVFKYYLNPDYTMNLEFNRERNLFTGLKSFEQVGIN